MENTKEASFTHGHSPHQRNAEFLLKNGKPDQKNHYPEKIRYLPSEIKVCKTAGKRTASAMCAFQRQKQIVKSKDAIKHRSVSECADVFGSKREDSRIREKETTSSSTCSTITHSDAGLDYQQNMDDVMSTVSDISDLSVMSLNSSHLHIGGMYRHQKQSMIRKTSQLNRAETINENVAQSNNVSNSHEKG